MIANAKERMLGDFNETDDDEYQPSHQPSNQTSYGPNCGSEAIDGLRFCGCSWRHCKHQPSF
jgi:hypothetical protein